jgi:hypothetical protein
MLAMTVLATGCLDRELKPLNPCLVSGVSRKVTVNNVDKVDLLFMVDNSNSMAEEQGALKAQFPKLISVLTSGNRFMGDPDPFPPVKDLHLGVVSSDMGIPGVNFGANTNCLPDGGDDGKMQHTPRGTGCDATYPTFLSYSLMGGTNQAKFANDFACIASLGTGGCGFEQQLESPLKALWPAIFKDEKGNVVTPNPITFLSTTMQGTLGRGDVPLAQGGNAGFLRNDPITGLSLIAIVVVTDEEDCSSRTTDHLKPANQYPADSPFVKQDLNLRCYYNAPLMYDVANRYLKGFRLLRQGNEQLVVFAAITGVPPTLVEKKVLDMTDFSNEGARNQFYDTILSDARMQEVVDPGTMPGSGMGNLTPSCVRTDTTGNVSKAYPPRRIVQLAKLFGENGVVQSICQDDFGSAMDAIINVIAKQLGAVCLPRPLVRKSDGKVGCNVVWELPPPGMAPTTTPTECSQAPGGYLGPVDPGRAPINDRKGNNCKVAQLMVTESAPKSPPPAGDGWYYDNFTDELTRQCSKAQPQRVAFTSTAKPPTGVIVKLECLNETQRLANTQKNVNTSAPQPEIGSPCKNTMGGATGDEACKVGLDDGSSDDRMFCHPAYNTCVRKCTSSTDCPPAWVCDDRMVTLDISTGRAFCVNPTCGSN